MDLRVGLLRLHNVVDGGGVTKNHAEGIGDGLHVVHDLIADGIEGVEVSLVIGDDLLIDIGRDKLHGLIAPVDDEGFIHDLKLVHLHESVPHDHIGQEVAYLQSVQLLVLLIVAPVNGERDGHLSHMLELEAILEQIQEILVDVLKVSLILQNLIQDQEVGTVVMDELPEGLLGVAVVVNVKQLDQSSSSSSSGMGVR